MANNTINILNESELITRKNEFNALKEIKTVTVLGANGTMGKNVSGIFASFGNAKVYMICRTKEKAEVARKKAYESIRSESIKMNLIPATYDDLEKCISESDLIFESLKEDFSIKEMIYKKIKPFLKKNAIIGTGTSGLSIKKLSSCFDDMADHFYGIHMFNPPYNLTLCELVLHSNNQESEAAKLSEYLSKQLNRTVVRVKDQPSFLGNRIGFFFINEAFKLSSENKDNGGIDYIDSILGCFTGRSMAPLVTADFVGLDVTKSIVDYIHTEAVDEFIESFRCEYYLNDLVAKGKLGKKTKCGIYYKDIDRNIIFVYDIKQQKYRIKNNYQFYFANEMISNIRVGNYEKATQILLEDESHEAILCKEMLLKYIIYSLKTAYEVSDDIYACDDAMATGFNWIPPIALMNMLGGIDNIKYLASKYLDSSYINIINNEKIITLLDKKSKYDYRPFLKAKY